MRRCLTGLVCFALAGCGGNPFAPAEEDYARRVALERLREIAPAPIEQYRRPAESAPPDVEAARRRFENVTQIELSIEEGRASALRHNLDLAVALVAPTIAAEQVSEEEARFESLFTLRAGYSEFDSPTATDLASAQAKNLTIIPGVRIPTRTGGSVTVGLPMSRNENDNQFSTLNPSFAADVELSLSHNLLRGAGRRANTAALRIAGYNRQSVEAQTKLEVIRQLAAVDRAYWRLFQARRELEVAQQQYELAVEQEARAQRRVDAGLSPPIEVTRAQAGVAERLEAIITAQNNVLLRQRELKRIINLPGLTLDTPTMIVTSTPPDPVEYVFDTQELVARALDTRMEMLEMELRLAADAANIAFARNQTLPLLTLDYTYRINGLGGSAQDAFHTLQRNRFEDWELGLTAEIPLGNEAAKSRLRMAILQRLQRLATKEARRLAITEEVLNAVDAINAGWQRVLAARQSVILNRRALLGEQRQFDLGGSTSTDVLNAATRLAEAELSEARALADYQIAQVDLAFATGTLLGAAKVVWEPRNIDEAETHPAETVP